MTSPGRTASAQAVRPGCRASAHCVKAKLDAAGQGNGRTTTENL